MLAPCLESTSAALTGPRTWVDEYRLGLHIAEQGRVLSVGDGIAWISGLPSAAMDDVLVFSDGSLAVVSDLNVDLIGAVLLHQTPRLTAGEVTRLTHQTLSVPAGDALLGRVIDPLGIALDGKAPLHTLVRQPLQSPSPPITARDLVRQPLYTGSKIIDTLIPVGKGQRQLIVGDSGLGRSALALDAVLQQRGKHVTCVYVLVGQKRSTVVNTIETLRVHRALDYTTIVVAEGSALPGLKYQAPFAGCAIAEYWMAQGRDTLVVYDDLSTHAKTYRELSLLLRRPPGREAYPGDIFSVHASLLERATCLNAEHGGGSMTALPVVETNQGEIAAYIPTNLISITDGQIYLERELFASGFRPAIDISRSVSRIGGQAQHPRIKEEAGRMKLDYLQFLELEMFTRFGARLEASMAAAVERGRILREILKQENLAPLPIEFHLAWLIAFNDGRFDGTPPEQIAGLLGRLANGFRDCTLTLDHPRADWATALRSWMGIAATP